MSACTEGLGRDNRRTAGQIAPGALHSHLAALACHACVELHVEQVHQQRVRPEDLRHRADVDGAVSCDVCIAV